MLGQSISRSGKSPHRIHCSLFVQHSIFLHTREALLNIAISVREGLQWFWNISGFPPLFLYLIYAAGATRRIEE